MAALWKKQLFHQIQALTTSVHLTNDLRTILTAAREARNYLAHDFGLGIQHEIETDAGLANRLTDLGNQITTLATADMLVCLLMYTLPARICPVHSSFLSILHESKNGFVMLRAENDARSQDTITIATSSCDEAH